MSTLRVSIQLNGKTQYREVSKDSFSVGRSVECDIALNDSHISRIHLIVHMRKGQVWIEDKNSSNGTFINGTQVTAGNLTSVEPSDKIQLGKSEYLLSFEIKAGLPNETLPPVLSAPVEPKKQEEKVVPQKKSEPVAAKAPPASEPAVAPVAPVAKAASVKAPEPSEDKFIGEARKKAAQIILEGEAQAEKRVQAIYQKAKETQAQAEKQHQERLQQANKEAEALLEKYQEQGREIIQEARKLAQNLRDEVDAYVQSLKDKADTENAEMLRKSKEEGLQQAKDEAKKLHADNQEAHRVLQKLNDEIKKYETDLKKLNDDCESNRTSLKDLSQRIQEKEKQLQSLDHEEQQIHKSIKSLEEDLQKQQDKQVQVAMDLQSLEDKRAQMIKDFEAQKLALTEKFEKERIEREAQEEERIEELRLDFSRRQEKMEKDLLSEVIRTKEDIIKSIFNSVEKAVVTASDTAVWGKASANVHKSIREAIDEKVAAFSRATGTQKTPENLLKKRKLEQTRMLLTGLAAGVCAVFVGQRLLHKISKDQNPMQTAVQLEAQRRQEDLERRRFNPPQVDEVKDSYTDSVIYTRGFVEKYTEPAFQKKMYKATSHYLFKTWRIDEDKSIQVLSTVTALIKELEERKGKIHPDFVKEGLEKMRTLESETSNRMKDLLGSEVRLESFRRFEKNFLNEELRRRQTAAQPTTQ